MPYQPIENYGLIGNMRTTALVGMNGSIDWLCFPHFDSPSVFAAILDDDKGGRFSIAPVPNHVKSKQYYWPDTNVLVTRFHTTDGVGRLIDFHACRKRSRRLHTTWHRTTHPNHSWDHDVSIGMLPRL